MKRALGFRVAVASGAAGTLACAVGLAVGCGSGGSGGVTPPGSDAATDGTLHDARPDRGPSRDTSPGDTAQEAVADGGGDVKDAALDIGASVLEFHLNPARDGHYVDPLMTPSYVANMKFDPAFIGASAGPGVPIGGPYWGQPLYVENGVGGKGTLYVADDGNDIYAFDEATGNTVWSKAPLIASVLQDASCGEVIPTGVTSTPIIDLASRTLYFVSATGMTNKGIQSYQVYGVSIDDGSTRAGWPLDVSSLKVVGPSGSVFTPEPEGQRTALTLSNGNLYVAFGGRSLHCGTYVGWLLSIPVADPAKATAYASPITGTGIWAVGALASDGKDLFAATGNGYATSGLTWEEAQAEAIIRFGGGSVYATTNTKDYFAPSNWQALDVTDTDFGGSGPIFVDVAGATPSSLIVQLAKSGMMYLLDRTNLGGVGTGDGAAGEGLWSGLVANGKTRTAAATYTDATGTYVVFNGDGVGTGCPASQTGDLIFGQITPTSPPTFKTLWCAPSGGNMGSPIVTTTDAAGSNPIVWTLGPETSNQLTAWDAKTGNSLFAGGGLTMDKIRHWAAPIDVKGRIIVGATDKIYAFTGK